MYTKPVPLNRKFFGPQNCTHTWKNRETSWPSRQSKPTALSSQSTEYAIQPTNSRIGTSDTLTSHKLFLLFLGGSTEELKKMLDVNVLALSVCTIQAFQSMKEKRVDDGHIIHINRLDCLWSLSFVLTVTYFAPCLVFWSEQRFLQKDVPVLRSKARSHPLSVAR